MRRQPSAPSRLASAALAFLLASAVAVLASPAPASAHGTLAMSTPASGATVKEPVTTVALYFTERVANNAYFAVTAPGGKRVDYGWSYGDAKPLDKPVREYLLVDGQFEPREYSTGFPAVVKLAHLPAAGQYSVSYLSVASDGEPVRGTMSFRYTGRATAAPQGWQPPTDQPDPALVAAAEQHDTKGHQGSGTSSSAPPSTPPAVAAPPADSDDEGGVPGGVWAGGAVVLTLAAGGYLAWRRRPALAGRAPQGRPGRSGSAARGRGVGPKTRGRPGTPTRARADRTTVKAGADRTTVKAGAGRPATVDGAGSGAAGAEPVTGAAGRFRLGDARMALLVGAVVVALLAGFGIGRISAGDERAVDTRTAVGGPGQASAVSAMDGHQHAPGTGAHSHPGDGPGLVTGTTVSGGGYTLRPVQRTQPAGGTVDYRFRIVGADGQPATRFAVVHDRPLHLIVVGRDLSGYQHLHPTMAADGTWQVPLRLATPGAYRVYADFSVTTADGAQLPLVLGVDYHVPGAHTPAAVPPAQPQATVDPYTVSMEGTPTVGVSTPMVFRVGGPGEVRLERYLGAYGHLVVVREGDLGYVHVHPEPELVDGAVKFWLTAPSAGRYRAFFDFQIGGEVRTAAYTLDLP
ncbi:copper resistance protein CopC [Micromonospora sp. WMMD882]|uniref:copper resistance CopC family protein n=1 Tax=Micromonospora sp. WMMD882 TaxID=3015151 RepID=UPI00248D2998|nr:copper resistance protein CopC [Micromonospora sp. WMMD882]WBB81003.1 copper resistance protein CopC [Micromonospora sp. WMMD882]